MTSPWRGPSVCPDEPIRPPSGVLLRWMCPATPPKQPLDIADQV